MDVRFTASAYRHGASRENILAAMEAHGEPLAVMNEAGTQVEFWWFGEDDRGTDLEVMGVERAEYMLIVHAMPLAYRRRR